MSPLKALMIVAAVWGASVGFSGLLAGCQSTANSTPPNAAPGAPAESKDEAGGVGAASEQTPSLPAETMKAVVPEAQVAAAAAASAGVPEAAEPIAPFAEPIAPDTVRRHPHLKLYVGHVVLGAGDAQVVLAGVPPRPQTATWLPTVLAAFERDASAKVWRAKPALGVIDLANAPGEAASLGPIALDLGANADEGAAYATFIYAAGGRPGPRIPVTWRLDAAAGILSYSVGESLDGAATLASGAVWRARLRGRDGATLLAPAAPAGAYGATKLAGVPMLMRYAGMDVSTVIGWRPFATREEFETLELTPAGLADAGPQGFDVLLTRAATQATWSRVAALRKCLYVGKPRTEARLASMTKCVAAAPRLPEVKLALPAEDAGGEVVPFPVFAYADGAPLLYAALTPSSPATLALPAGVSVQLADTRSGRAAAGVGAVTLAEGEAKELTLTPRRGGRVQIAADDGAPAPALLSISKLDLPAGEAGVVATARDGVERVAPNLYLVTTWPVELTLLAGGYDVTLSRGGDGVHCNARIAVSPGKTVSHKCQRPTYTTGIPAVPVAAPDGPVRPNPPAGSKESRVQFADTSFAPAVVGRTVDRAELEAWRAALGVDMLSVPLVATEAGPPAADASPQTLGAGDVPVLRVEDIQTGMSLQFLPTSAELATRWARAARRVGIDADRLGAFARFVRAEGGNGVLELGCPGPGVSLFDYELQAKRLSPDALRLFGCPYGGDQSDLLALWARLSAGRRTPFLLTSVSLVERPGAGLFFPRLFVNKPKAPDGAPEPALASSPLAGLVADLRAGSFGLSSGAVVAINEARRAASGRAATPDLTLVVGFASTPDVKPRTLLVWSEKGLVRRETLGTQDGPVGQITTAFDVPPDARWLRLELRGTPPRAAFARMFDRGDGVILATTNFMPVASFAASAAQKSGAPLARRPESAASQAPKSGETQPAEGDAP